MQILNLMKLADIFTVGNLCCGILSILLAIDGYFDLSALLLFVAVVFDVLDGKIAGLLIKRICSANRLIPCLTWYLWRCTRIVILLNEFSRCFRYCGVIIFCRLRYASACTLQHF